MRYLLTLLLTVLIPLNAAYAAATGVCDALEHAQNHTTHFGHHSHEHGGHDAQSVDSSQSPEAGDLHHAHVHPGFATLLSGTVDVTPLDPHSTYIATPRRSFVSAPPARLDRPPRTALT